MAKYNKYRLLTSRLWLTSALITALIVLAAAYQSVYPVVETGRYDLKYPENFGNRIFIPADNPLTKEGVYLGRMLFYEPLLSGNNKISCATCHQQRLAFTDGRTLARGIGDTLNKRNTMSLSNLLWVKNFFWDSRARGLEAQALVPITNAHEMGGSIAAVSKKLSNKEPYSYLFRTVYGNDSITEGRIVKAISQFERTLISANSDYDKYLRNEYTPTKGELRGMDLFMTIPAPEKNIRGANCGRCHGTPKMFIELLHNNGLDSISRDEGRAEITGLATDKGRFRVPTLRNIALTSPYMHDGRFKTLEEVLDHYNGHLPKNNLLSPLLNNVSNNKGGGDLSLTMQEKKDIISFLQMLSDSTFISDTRFANPHTAEKK